MPRSIETLPGNSPGGFGIPDHIPTAGFVREGTDLGGKLAVSAGERFPSAFGAFRNGIARTARFNGKPQPFSADRLNMFMLSGIHHTTVFGSRRTEMSNAEIVAESHRSGTRPVRMSRTAVFGHFATACPIGRRQTACGPDKIGHRSLKAANRNSQPPYLPDTTKSKSRTYEKESVSDRLSDRFTFVGAYRRHAVRATDRQTGCILLSARSALRARGGHRLRTVGRQGPVVEHMGQAADRRVRLARSPRHTQACRMALRRRSRLRLARLVEQCHLRPLQAVDRRQAGRDRRRDRHSVRRIPQDVGGGPPPPQNQYFHRRDRRARGRRGRSSQKKPTKYGRCMPAIPAIGR